ncbi:hypothetical protein EDC01DRAFT_645401 [Geopyxis carbonaria]|nr:hypothetical protein EDC01DRAFT_645401 [Geopyxis carbonaria]
MEAIMTTRATSAEQALLHNVKLQPHSKVEHRCSTCDIVFPSKKRLTNHGEFSHPIVIEYRRDARRLYHATRLTTESIYGNKNRLPDWVAIMSLYPDMDPEDLRKFELLCHNQSKPDWSESIMRAQAKFMACTVCRRDIPITDADSVRQHESTVKHIEALEKLTCRVCTTISRTKAEHKAHNNKSHVMRPKNGTKEDNRNYCWTCHRAFSDRRIYRDHRKEHQIASAPTEIHCKICKLSPQTSNHFEAHRKACAYVTRGLVACLHCSVFVAHKVRIQHILSDTHRPVRCAGAKTCNRSFKTPADMIQHLESGGCLFTLDNNLIEVVLRANNVRRAVDMPTTPEGWMFYLSQVAPESTDLDGFDIFAPKLSTRPESPSTTVIDDNDDDNAANDTIFTPTSTVPSTPGMWTPVSSDVGFTPHSGSGCRSRSFSDSFAATRHIASPTIYRCPRLHKRDRVFKTLGGLVMHLQAHAEIQGRSEQWGWERVLQILADEDCGVSL